MRGFADISGEERYTIDDVRAWLSVRGANADARHLVNAIYQVREKFPAAAPAPDFLCVQAMHETGFCTWAGGAKRWNPAGIKLAGASGDTIRDFERPATAEAAAHMLLNHWASLIPYEPVAPVHGRYAVARDVYARNGARGKTRTVDDLGGGIWAMDREYAPKLRKYLQQLEDRVRPGGKPGGKPGGGSPGKTTKTAPAPRSGSRFTGRANQLDQILRARFPGIDPHTYRSHGYAASKSGYTEKHAIDVMVAPLGVAATGAQKKLGDDIAAFCLKNFRAFGLGNVIWFERFNGGSGWVKYDWEPYYRAGYGSRDPEVHKHVDHVHIQCLKDGLIGEYEW